MFADTSYFELKVNGDMLERSGGSDAMLPGSNGVARTYQDLDAARAFYTRISSIYDTLADRGEHRVRELGLSLLNARKGERILEIGFGTGSALVPLAAAVGASGHVFGVDLSSGMKAVAEQRVRAANPSAPITTTVAAVPPIPFGTDTFDAVFMSFTLELFPDEIIPGVLREIRRTLRPGGRFAVVSMALTLEQQRRCLSQRVYAWLHRCFPRIIDCRPIDVERWLVEGGFTVARVERRDVWRLPVLAVLAR